MRTAVFTVRSPLFIAPHEYLSFRGIHPATGVFNAADYQGITSMTFDELWRLDLAKGHAVTRSHDQEEVDQFLGWLENSFLLVDISSSNRISAPNSIKVKVVRKG
jgi:hypothetical protein